MRTLTLALKGIYFDQIAAGTKDEEFRLVTPFWQKRLVNRTYDRIVLTRGYPKASDTSRRIERPWRGFVTCTITHPHFGPDPVEVFAIRVAARTGASRE
uniref:ASCH domain-containing protein n=1 Tax=Burkholderia cenocepacia TaxID=95486 RepID=UPI002AB78CB8|nr:ASCH domain-containing protein [Burkholderia cenocepacia]